MDSDVIIGRADFPSRHCLSSFLAESIEINKHCFIDNRVKQSIGVELSDAISLKDLSKRHFVFPTTINRVLNTLGKELSNTFTHLPQNLCFDELTSIKNQHGNTVLSILILSDNKIINLETHFLKYSLKI